MTDGGNENNVPESDIILDFLGVTEDIFDNGRKYIMSRFLPAYRDHVSYNVVTRGFTQDGKEKYAVTLTLTVVFDKDEIIRRYEYVKNRQDRISQEANDKIEEEEKKANEYLKERKEKLKNMRPKN